MRARIAGQGAPSSHEFEQGGDLESGVTVDKTIATSRYASDSDGDSTLAFEPRAAPVDCFS